MHPSNGDGIAHRARRINLPQSIETTTVSDVEGREYTCEISSDLHGTAVVEQWVIEGQGHAWSGGRPEGSYTDQKGPDASAEMIRFFFQKGAPTSA
ncbi:hypothetical protein AAD018_006125 [Aestuariibius insulae]|uniref:hypothetical protein n=1 Tax=Aestuariibius insulae TaxID=2058287 RepID=UPI00398E4159